MDKYSFTCDQTTKLSAAVQHKMPATNSNISYTHKNYIMCYNYSLMYVANTQTEWNEIHALHVCHFLFLAASLSPTEQIEPFAHSD